MSHKHSQQLRIEAQAREWLVRLNRSHLSAEQEAEFFTWLQASPLHQAAYINAEDLWQRGAVFAKVSTTAPSGTAHKAEMPWVWALAATCLFAMSAWFFLPGQPVTQHYVSQVGEQREVVLDEGSRLILNSQSSISIEMASSSRTAILERGEVFFDVAPDADRPFSVNTSDGMVRVVGTRFSVRKLDQDTSVTVLEGKVALGNTPSDNDFQAKQVLEADQRLSLKQALAGQAPEKVEAQNLLAWRSGQLIFKGRALAEVVVELERYFAVNIDFANPDLATREITAVLQLTDQQTAFNQLAMALDLTWQTGDKQGEWLLVEAAAE